MTKAKKKLTYKDFLQPTLSDKPSQLFLSNDDGLTDLYLEVLSYKHPSIKRAVTSYALAENKIKAECWDEEKDLDNIGRIHYFDDECLPHRKELALAMVSNGNFEGFVNVLDNPDIVNAVIARSYDTSEYAIKK